MAGLCWIPDLILCNYRKQVNVSRLCSVLNVWAEETRTHVVQVGALIQLLPRLDEEEEEAAFSARTCLQVPTVRVFKAGEDRKWVWPHVEAWLEVSSRAEQLHTQTWKTGKE